ncbi:MAG: pantoate--beta-alanine ligase [Vampirovibrionia bacterium]
MSTKSLSIFKNKADIRSFVNQCKREGKVVGFVPTMGCLHNGHLSLIEASKLQCDVTVVSIFVNPTQFGPNEDFDSYPRTFEQDIKSCEQLKVNAIFAPSDDEMYTSDKQNMFTVSPPHYYVDKLCGSCRPGHFEGVATVVTKLFNIIPADKVFMGQKDAQQLFIIKKMVEQLDIPLEIIGCPIVREHDGLALSSRNNNLDKASREIAPSLYQILTFIKSEYLAGITDFSIIVDKINKHYVEIFEQVSLEYLQAYDYDNLSIVSNLKSNTLVAIAAKVGKVRLIDNIILD